MVTKVVPALAHAPERTRGRHAVVTIGIVCLNFTIPKKSKLEWAQACTATTFFPSGVAAPQLDTSSGRRGTPRFPPPSSIRRASTG